TFLGFVIFMSIRRNWPCKAEIDLSADPGKCSIDLACTREYVSDKGVECCSLYWRTGSTRVVGAFLSIECLLASVGPFLWLRSADKNGFMAVRIREVCSLAAGILLVGN